MKILGIADVTSVHTLKWANGLARRGHAVHLVSYAAGDPAVAYPPEVTIHPRALAPLALRRPWSGIRCAFWLRSLWSRLRPDLVHAHFLGHGAWTAAAAGLKPLVVSVMGGGDLVGTRWAPTTRVERALTPLTLERAALVVCWSRNLERIVREIGGSSVRTAVVVGGIDRSVFRPGEPAPVLRERLALPPGAFVVFSPRLFWPRQNIETILRGFALFRRERPEAVLLLVRYRAGEFPEYARRMDDLVSSLGIREGVRSLPTILNAEMADYFRLANVTVSIPSTDGTPMTAMESLACGTPVVMSDLPDYDPEIFGRGEATPRVDPADPIALSRALLRLATDGPARAQIVSAGARTVAEHADEDHELDRLQRLYDDVLSRS